MPAALQIRKRASTDARHLMRYLKFKAGVPPADLAKEERVNIKAVMASIREMEAYESRNSDGQVMLAVRDMIIKTIPIAQKTLTGLLEANNNVEIKNQKTGLMDRVVEPDKTTRLEALRVHAAMIAATQPKVPNVVTNVNQTNQTAVITSRTETTEERMRRLRAKAAEHNLLPREVAAMPTHMDKRHKDLDADGPTIIDTDDDDEDDDE